MTEGVRDLVLVSAALASGDTAGLEEALRAVARSARAEQVEEALLQSYLFLGYPASLRGLAIWRRLSGRTPPPARRDEAEWESRGAATCERVYGGQYGRLRANVAALHPDMERWMVVEGYGKVLGRPGLELAVRELCIVALLAPQDAAPQLYAHLRGALNAGAPAAEVAEVVELLAPRLPPQRSATLREQWLAVSTRRGAPVRER